MSPLTQGLRYRAACDEHLTFSDQISSLFKSCYSHIRQLRCIRPYLDSKTASTIAASIVHSKLDYCNSLYYNQAGLTLNLKKCKWAKEQVKYCGKIVGNGKILPDPDKIKIVASMNPPKNRKEWR